MRKLPEEKNTKGHSSKWNLSVMQSIIAHLYEVKPRIYWSDFLFSSFIGWFFFIISIKNTVGSIHWFICLCIASLALYRSVSFMHEIAHLRKNSLPGFHFTWTILIGIPMMIPSFLYTDIHLAHHHKNKFGTELDGEYVPFGRNSFFILAKHFLGHFILPLLIITRFAFLAPISFLHPKLRKLIKENFSGISIKMPFKREISHKKEDRIFWLFEEITTCFVIWFVILNICFGILPTAVIIQYAIVAFLIAVLNSIRTIGGTHRYLSSGQELSFQNQFTDSINIDSSRLDSLLLCPVGLRYHALHHLFAGLPYHALEKAHLCLKNTLPPDHDYHQSSLPTVWAGWQQILGDMKRVHSSYGFTKDTP